MVSENKISAAETVIGKYGSIIPCSYKDGEFIACIPSDNRWQLFTKQLSIVFFYRSVCYC